MRMRRLAWCTTLLAGGVAFQFLGCSPAGVANLLTNFQPCGTILNCDPRVFGFARSGIDGPGLRPDVDPFCTFPPFCNAQQDPLFGFAGP